MAKVDQELDRLYGFPIEEFVAARNELSRRLKNESGESRAVYAYLPVLGE
jgi:hypothetical protein